MQRPHPATSQEMSAFHANDYIDFLYRVTPENQKDFMHQLQKCMRFFHSCIQMNRLLKCCLLRFQSTWVRLQIVRSSTVCSSIVLSTLERRSVSVFLLTQTMNVSGF